MVVDVLWVYDGLSASCIASHFTINDPIFQPSHVGQRLKRAKVELSEDLFGQLVPDIVVRTKVGCPANYANRIIIEVKYATGLRKPYETSQVVRYFLHLLVTTTKGNPEKDGARALVLAAPASWFADARNSAAWNYFRRTYGDLAEVFDITLAELHLDALI
jgi:hypothetical protein